MDRKPAHEIGLHGFGDLARMRPDTLTNFTLHLQTSHLRRPLEFPTDSSEGPQGASCALRRALPTPVLLHSSSASSHTPPTSLSGKEGLERQGRIRDAPQARQITRSTSKLF